MARRTPQKRTPRARSARAGGRKPPSRRPLKFLFVVGGVMSGVGKGVASASLAMLLEARGVRATALKIDPYINVDAGTMNPTEHGEVFVLADGMETDQDMGNYERFLNRNLSRANYMTTGSVYLSVIEKERNLAFGGRNVEVVPDIPLEVIARIRRAAELDNAQVAVVEIGGTVGEYQNILFLEAIRMLKIEQPDDVGVVLVSYLPVPSTIGEMKTKPTQYAARALNSAGVFADLILARAPQPLDAKRREKIARSCNVPPQRVISAPDVSNIYEVPLNFEREHISQELCSVLGLQRECAPQANVRQWQSMVRKARSARREVRIAVVGKYFHSGEFVLSDVYLSVLEAIKFSAWHQGLRPVLEYVSSVPFERGAHARMLDAFDGIVVPGGFGARGIDGTLKAITYARTHHIPYLGLCYGMQLMVVEFARNVAGLKGAHTAEIDPHTPHPVVAILPEQAALVKQNRYGGTMRLGEYPALLKPGTIAAEAYFGSRAAQRGGGGNGLLISERHRHRYEVNPEYVPMLEAAGLVFSGTSPDGRLMEIAELPRERHPFMVGTQFHPEFHARPLAPHPLFSAFIRASAAQRSTQEAGAKSSQ
ncbi:MAG: CTP synthetase [Candidatus Parcubacteria bacterium]|nr:MAG: CTP synthetase [Candidatus Parcubacteria bacterium]